MISKKTCESAPSFLKHLEYGVDIPELRKKLTSVGWIQCDNPGCLKWRTVKLEVAQQVKEDTPWTCNMNEDQNYNRCSVPEEDTSLYDKLAKMVNLDFVTSKLKPGSLVWAKVYGYCRWPAIITADPLNGQYLEENEIEALQYHVEFLGDTRSHGWIKTKLIEVFGPGNVDQSIDNKSASISSQVIKGKVKRHRKMTCTPGSKHYEKSLKVQKAIQEALQLLPLRFEARLKTCQFVSSLYVNEVIVPGKRLRNEKIKVPEMKRLNNSKNKNFKKEPSSESVLRDVNNNTESAANRKLCSRNKVKKFKFSSCLDIENNENVIRMDVKCLDQAVKGKVMNEKGSMDGKISENLHTEAQKPEFFEFPSLLFNTSKEERFMKDVQMYQQKECIFEQEIAVFMQKCGLMLHHAPTWQNIQISKFSIFLAVMERDGFVKVCEQHQWPSVYTEVTHQHFNLGGDLVKRFYIRNLHPFELYISGHDYTLAVKELHRQLKKCPTRIAVNEGRDSGVDTDDLETLFDEDDSLDNPEIIKHLDELDQILKSLEQKPKIENDGTAHVMPLQDFCESVGNSTISDTPMTKHSTDVQVLHEMQALQYDLDFLHDQIDLL